MMARDIVMVVADNKHRLAFTLLCVTAPMAFVMYALTHAANQFFADLCSTIGFAALLLLLGSSLWSLRRHPRRAIAGLLTSAFVFWLALMIPGDVKAKEARQEKPPVEAGELLKGHNQ